jgi:hypothetical protein
VSALPVAFSVHRRVHRSIQAEVGNQVSVYRVYWSSYRTACPLCGFEEPLCYCEEKVPPKLEAHAEDFGPEEMSEALNYCAELRKDKSNSFITLVAENPNSVSNGVSAPSPDYNWEKRRGGRK